MPPPVRWEVLHSSAAPSTPSTRIPLPEALRRDIAAMVRALPDDELLALVGDRLADLVARRAALAPPAHDEPRPASSPAKPRARRAGPGQSALAPPLPAPIATPQSRPDHGRKSPMLPWPRAAEDGTPLGIDLAAPGLTARTKTIADDVRHLVLARFRGTAARLLDPDDLVQEVHRRLIIRNQRPCAFDPRQGSISHYVYQVTTGAIADLMKIAKRRDEQELLTLDPSGYFDPAAPEPDAPLDLDAAPTDPDEREDFFLALCCLEVLGELPVKEPLWQRALRQREKDQARERAEQKRAAKAKRKQRRAALDAEVLAFLQSETAQGRPVIRSELAVLLGVHLETVRDILDRLMKAGAVEVRRPGGPRPATYWALPEAKPNDFAIVGAAHDRPVNAEPAPELPPEPAPPVVQAPVAPIAWLRRRLNAKRLHASFIAGELAALAPPAPEAFSAGR